MMNQLGLEESILINLFWGSYCGMLFFLTRFFPRIRLTRIKVLESTTDDIHQCLVCTGVTQLKLIEDSSQFEQVFDTLFVLL